MHPQMKLAGEMTETLAGVGRIVVVEKIGFEKADFVEEQIGLVVIVVVVH